MDDQPISLINLVDRLGKLDGLLMGLQLSINQGQAQTSAFMARVERLEARQVELERNMITRDDISQLVAKVDKLGNSDARTQGGRAVATWSASALATWAAIAISVLALLSTAVQRERIQGLQPRPAPTSAPSSR
jgi:hypothetical protein